ncbi:DUF6221 family protein [Streptomyces sp. QTS52]
MDELVRWLGEQLALDEAHARKDLWAAEKATAGRWRARYGVNLDHSWIETESTPVVRLDGARHEADALLVARFQPETVRKRAEAKLADIEAKRRILTEVVYWNERASREAVDPPKFPQPGLDLGLLLDAMNPVPRLLALPYADRPGYREEWRP